jgi:hypothetical protein
VLPKFLQELEELGSEVFRSHHVRNVTACLFGEQGRLWPSVEADSEPRTV